MRSATSSPEPGCAGHSWSVTCSRARRSASTRIPSSPSRHANSGSARAFADLLHALWVPDRIPADAAALTESRVPAVIQPAAEDVMGHVAQALHDQLRDGLAPCADR